MANSISKERHSSTNDDEASESSVPSSAVSGDSGGDNIASFRIRVNPNVKATCATDRESTLCHTRTDTASTAASNIVSPAASAKCPSLLSAAVPSATQSSVRRHEEALYNEMDNTINENFTYPDDYLVNSFTTANNQLNDGGKDNDVHSQVADDRAFAVDPVFLFEPNSMKTNTTKHVERVSTKRSFSAKEMKDLK